MISTNIHAKTKIFMCMVGYAPTMPPQPGFGRSHPAMSIAQADFINKTSRHTLVP